MLTGHLCYIQSLEGHNPSELVQRLQTISGITLPGSWTRFVRDKFIVCGGQAPDGLHWLHVRQTDKRYLIMSEISFVCILIRKALLEAHSFMRSLICRPAADGDEREEPPHPERFENRPASQLDTAKWEVKIDWKIEQAKEVIDENELQTTINMLEKRIAERREAFR